MFISLGSNVVALFSGSVSMAFGDPEKDTRCCEGISYDRRCWDCKSGRVTPMFDHENQVQLKQNIIFITNTKSDCIA